MLNENPESNNGWVERFKERVDVLNGEEWLFCFLFTRKDTVYFWKAFVEIMTQIDMENYFSTFFFRANIIITFNGIAVIKDKYEERS